MVDVRLVRVPAARVVNLTSPRYEITVGQSWSGLREWHDPLYEPLRDIMERLYVDGFNAENGHYARLEADVLKSGIRNPVMLVSGKLQHRWPCELPPQWRGRRDMLVSEYLGGSRLHIAQKHRLDVPAIVNDFGNLFPGERLLSTVDEIAACFEVRPRTIRLSEADGAYVNDMHYSHMPEGYTLREQVPVRARVVQTVKAAVAQWLAENDRP